MACRGFSFLKENPQKIPSNGFCLDWMDPKDKRTNFGSKKDLSTAMAQDWDRRIRHDYRYWMSDGVESDEAMWETGERDMSMLLGRWPQDKIKGVAVEIGCGVGRLLRAASDKFQQVIGWNPLMFIQ